MSTKGTLTTKDSDVLDPSDENMLSMIEHKPEN
jgi:hypothetical protein